MIMQAAELLERLVTSDSNPKLLPWLLMQLAAARPTAQQLPRSSQEFYELLSSMIGKLCASGSSWGHLPQQLFAMANQMLDEEVDNLRAVAVAPPAAAASAAVAASEDASAADAACMLLQGRLQLVLALVRALDRRGIGSDSQGGLIKLLLQVKLLVYSSNASACSALSPLGVLESAARVTGSDTQCWTARCSNRQATSHYPASHHVTSHHRALEPQAAFRCSFYFCGAVAGPLMQSAMLSMGHLSPSCKGSAAGPSR
jgi:hypothetical protein